MIASAVPGRIRLRAARRATAEQLIETARAVQSLPGVTDAEVRAQSASIVVRFDPRDAEAVEAGLRETGVDLPADAVSRRGDPAKVVADAARAMNGAVGRRVPAGDLRLLLPLGLGLLSVRQAMRGRDRLADAPWYVLAWYASETFFKFHGQPAPRRHLSPAREEM